MIDIKIFNDTIGNKIPRKSITKSVVDVLKSEKIKRINVNIIFVDDKFIKDINKKYLNHNFETDVISFNLEDNNCLIGEIYISIDTAKVHAKDYGVSLRNELKRLAVHGVLHLLGYQDDTKENKARMHYLEDKYIN